jgi:hypothetical protein
VAFARTWVEIGHAVLRRRPIVRLGCIPTNRRATDRAVHSTLASVVRIGIAADHRGTALKAELTASLRAAGYKIEDYGA